MKSIFILILISAFCTSLNAQDYIITKSGKKIECGVKSVDHKKVYTNGDNGAEVKYDASELSECYFKGTKYIVGEVPAGTYGVRVWCLLKVYVEGDMNLVLLTVKYNTKSEFNGTTTSTAGQAENFFVFLEGAPNNSYEKMGITWRKTLVKMGSSCSQFTIKVKETDSSTSDNLSALVNYYNENCK